MLLRMTVPSYCTRTFDGFMSPLHIALGPVSEQLREVMQRGDGLSVIGQLMEIGNRLCHLQSKMHLRNQRIRSSSISRAKQATPDRSN